MKKTFSKYCAQGVISLLCVAAFSQPALAKIKCESMTATANLNLLSPVGPTVGIANFLIDDEASSATVVVNLLAAPILNADGSQSIMSRLDYDFGGGDTVVGFAVGVLTPTAIPGVFSNAQKVTYVDGTGKYENVVSRIIAEGEVNFLDNTATQQGVGDICTAVVKMEGDD